MKSGGTTRTLDLCECECVGVDEKEEEREDMHDEWRMMIDGMMNVTDDDDLMIKFMTYLSPSLSKTPLTASLI